MDPALRRSAAHVLVADVAVPALDEPTSHHLGRVLRLRDGDAVTVTDGAGSWRTCVIEAGGVAPSGEVVIAPPPSPTLTVAVAPPKGDRLDWLVAKSTEAGVDRVVLLDADRSVVRLRPDRSGRQLDRLRRVAVEAAMQSRRVWLPSIEGPQPASGWLTTAAVAEPGGRPLGPHDTAIVIGPEGGWSDGELAAVAEGQTVSLAANVLRVETAAVAAVVLMASHRSAAVHR